MTADRTIATLEELRVRLCPYSYPGYSPTPCDCKYANVGSAGRPLGVDEATGCPELRDAIRALTERPALLAETERLREALNSCAGFLDALRDDDLEYDFTLSQYEQVGRLCQAAFRALATPEEATDG